MIATALQAGARPRFLVREEEGSAEARGSAGDKGHAGAEGASGARSTQEPIPPAAPHLPPDLEHFTAPPELFRTLADTETPQGLLAVFEEPPHDLASLAPPPAGARYLVLDALQDPGNVGTLLRTAAAFGVTAALLLDGTADPWSPKAVRAAAGELFRLPVVRTRWDKARGWLEAHEVAMLVADGAGQDLRTVPLPPAPLALLVGNEGAGPRPEVRDAAHTLLALPLGRGVESLNAAMAGSILLWALGPGAPSTLVPPAS